ARVSFVVRPITPESVMRERSSSSHWGERDIGLWLRSAEAGLYEAGCLAEIHLPGKARFQFGHDLAHILDRFGADFRLDRFDGGADFGIGHLLREEFLDHRQFALFLIGQLLTPALLVHGDGFAAL